MDSNNPHQHHDSSLSPSSPLPIQSSSSSAMTHSSCISTTSVTTTAVPFSSSLSPSPTPIQSSMATAQSSPISMPSTTTTAIPHSSSSSPSPAPVQPYCTACSSTATSMAVMPLVSQSSTSTHDSMASFLGTTPLNVISTSPSNLDLTLSLAMPGTAIVMKAPDTNVAMPCTSGERAQSATQYCTACSSTVTSMAVMPLVSQPSTSTHDSMASFLGTTPLNVISTSPSNLDLTLSLAMPETAIVMKAPDTNVTMPCTSGERAQSATQSMPETAEEPRKNDPPIPVGYRLVGNRLVFNPTDEELIQHLANKLKRESVPAIFEELDVFSFHPYDLMGKNTELYFFTKVERPRWDWDCLSRQIKYGQGRWKQGESIAVKSSDAVIGIKTILEFGEENTVYIPSLTHTFHMDEFRMKGVYETVTALCRIVKKKV